MRKIVEITRSTESGAEQSELVPLVSVFMTTYKEEPSRLRLAIRSILDQTLSELEFIIVFERDDPNFEFVRHEFSDPRLIVFQLPRGRGRSACHNAALDVARGKYLAPMDGDDIAYPLRLDRLVRFLEENRGIGVVGAAANLRDNDGRLIGVRRPPRFHDDIVRDFVFTNPLFHSVVIWSRERVGNHVRYYGFYSDDLELWLNMLARRIKFANVQDVLLEYRQPGDYNRPRAHWRGTFAMRFRHWRLCFIYPSMLAGILAFALLSLLPKWAISSITRRNAFSDSLRSITKHV